MNFRNHQIALVFFLLSPLAMAAEVTLTCPAFNDGTNQSYSYAHGSWMCAYVSPGQRVFDYVDAGGGGQLGLCRPAQQGLNMSLIHCPNTTHGASVPSMSCTVTIPDEVGGTVQWVPYQGNNWAYVDGAGGGATDACVHAVFAVNNPKPNPVPVDPVSCTATSVSIDHQNITPQEFNGSIASGKTTVSCSGGDGTVKLSFTTSSINLSNGGKSNLHFDNATGETTTTFTFSEDSSKTIDIYSVLSGTVSPGTFSGSTSLIMNVN